MNFIVQCIAIGTYTAMISKALPMAFSMEWTDRFSPTCVKKKYINIFLIGFLKHFLAYLFGIHEFYCRKYFNVQIQSNFFEKFIESIFEGLIFVAINHAYNLPPAAIAILLHVVFEVLNIHKAFCMQNCI